MSEATRERLFGYWHAFDHEMVTLIVIALSALLIATPILLRVLNERDRLSSKQSTELWQRYLSWLVLVPLLVLPVLAGAFWTIAGVTVLGLLCYREFGRVTGLSAHAKIYVTGMLGIVLVGLAALDHWYGFFVALFTLTICLMAAVAILDDRPQGYLQRVALGVFAFMLFGCALGHLGYLANDRDYRPIVLLVLLTVELNDIFAFCCGKLFGRRKLAPNTSPNKTVGGAVGALALTTLLVAGLGHFVFQGSRMDTPVHLLGLGAIVGVAGQMGDLMLSSVKRDLGIKDMGTSIPGHGGLLDRFDSVLLVAPAVFHYVAYFHGVGITEQTRIFSG